MFWEFSAFLLEVSGLAEEEESQVKWSTMGQVWAKLAPSWAQVEAKLGKLGPNWDQVGTKLGQVEPSWGQVEQVGTKLAQIGAR